jgi:NTE family protein
VIALIDMSSFFVMAPLVRLIGETIELSKIRNSHIKLVIAATNWGTGDLEIIDNQRMSDELGHRFIAASAAVPGFFPAVPIHNDPWVDGGVLLNTPLEPALRLGATTVHMIYMDPDLRYVPNTVLEYHRNF